MHLCSLIGVLRRVLIIMRVQNITWGSFEITQLKSSHSTVILREIRWAGQYFKKGRVLSSVPRENQADLVLLKHASLRDEKNKTVLG